MHARTDSPLGAPLTLTQRHTDLTRSLILDTAIDLLEAGPVAELTVRAVARRAQLAERTVFRYFATREEFLDGVALAGAARLRTPEPPTTDAELVAAPRALYGAFEAKTGLTRALLHPDLLPRMQATAAKRRWDAIAKLVDRIAAEAPARARRIAAANIRYYLAATSWHYYRFTFGFDFEEAVACAETAIALALEDIRAASRRRPSASARSTSRGRR
jgi:AcrR family transcriptional regulator